jgi:Tol biopolymer transport system component
MAGGLILVGMAVVGGLVLKGKGLPMMIAPATATVTATVTKTMEPTRTVEPTKTEAPTATMVPTATPIGGGSGKIAYVMGDGDAAEIYVMNVDGSHQTRLTQNDKRDFGPVWSPDGKKIAFSTEYFGNYKINVMNADGSDQKCLTNEYGSEMGPVWSPDGSKILYTDGLGGFVDWKAVKNDQLEVYVMNADGSEKTNLTHNTSSDYDPVWSPDGKKIAFVSDRYGSADVYMMNADGSEQVNVTKTGGDEINPSFSPDGKLLAYNPGIQYTNLDGTGKYAAKGGIYTNKPDPNYPGSSNIRDIDYRYASYDTIWIPDGSQIVSEGLFNIEWDLCGAPHPTVKVYKWEFPCIVQETSSNPNGGYWFPEVGFADWHQSLTHGIFAVDTISGIEIKLTDDQYGEFDPAISPDGRKILFIGRSGKEQIQRYEWQNNYSVKIMDLDGKNRVTLTGPGASDPAWAP